ncbi:MAG: choice-of-anchor Q domain-containing protein [Phycisphaerales bacterium]
MSNSIPVARNLPRATPSMFRGSAGCSRPPGRATRWAAASIASLTMVAGASISAADTFYVDAAAAPGGDGLAWNTAFAHVRDAVAATEAAVGPDEIRIAGGTYRPDTSAAVPKGTGERRDPMLITATTTLIGGFAGLAGPDPDVRDLESFPTILDADLNGDDVPGDPATTVDNAAGMIRASFSINEELVLDGIAFVRGSAEGIELDGRYSAVFVEGGTARIIACQFNDHRLGERSLGGGLRGDDANLHITGSSFADNEAREGGGLVLIGNGDLTLIGTEVLRCRANRRGGGFLRTLGSGDLTIENCLLEGNLGSVGASFNATDGVRRVRLTDTIIRDNRSTAGGAAFINIEGPGGEGLVERCRIEFNVGDNGVCGLGVVSNTSPLRVVDSIFRGNTTSSFSGALVIASTSGATDIVNCVFIDNEALESSALAANGLATRIINCTFVRNSSLAINTENAVMRNSIVWDCGPEPFRSIGFVTDSIVDGGFPGANNLDLDPQFVQVGTANLRLAFGSPAIDAGLDVHVPVDIEFDIAGSPRIQGAMVDMGAYEGAFEALPPVDDFPDIDPGEVVVGGLDGGDFDPANGPSFIFQNVGETTDATLEVAPVSAAEFPPAAGAAPMGTVRQFAVDLEDGDFVLLIIIPYTLADVEAIGGPGADPTAVRLVRREADTGAWAYATAGNFAPAVGADGPLADGLIQVGTPGPASTFTYGRWGTWWNPAEERGVAWATVDRAGAYGAGFFTCAADAHQPPNGSVDFADLLTVAGSWDRGAGPWDVNADAVVDMGDLIELLDDWGTCP